MIINDLLESQRSRALKFVPLIQKYASHKFKYEKDGFDKNISLYQNSSLLKENPVLLIDLYRALSIETLRAQNKFFHGSPNGRYDRFVSSHEYLIYQLLVEKHKLAPIRQLLIGESHADVYVPEIHLCIEASSERYFSTPRRVKSEKYSDYYRPRLNGLTVYRTEDYYRTRQDLERIVGSLRISQSQSSRMIQSNFFEMATGSMPYFIPYSDLRLIIKQESSVSPLASL